MKRYLLAILLLTSYLPGNESHYQNSLLYPYLKSFDYEKTSTGSAQIDRIYVINLDRRFTKWQVMLKRFEGHGYTPVRFPAVDGWQIPSSLIKEVKLPSSSLGRGEVGCFLSHLSILHDAYVNQYKAIWVLEDDVHFVEDIDIDDFLNRLEMIDPEWDVLYTDFDTKAPLFYSDTLWRYNRPILIFPRPEQKKSDYQSHFSREKIDEDFSRIYMRYGAYSMIISERGIQKILNYCLNQKLYTPYDADIHFIPGFREYIINRECISVIPGYASDTKRYKP